MRLKNGRYGGNRYMLATFAAIMILLISTVTRADIVTINIQAVVDRVNDPRNYLEGKIIPGSIINGYYIYDSTAIDEYPTDPTWGKYSYSTSPFGIFLIAGGFNFQTDPGNTNFRIDLANDLPGTPSPFDGYSVESSNNLPFRDNSPAYAISIGLCYPTNVLSSDELPLTSPSLDNLLYNNLIIYRIGGDIIDRNIIDAHVISAIPEPSSLVLISLGILGIFFKKR